MYGINQLEPFLNDITWKSALHFIIRNDLVYTLLSSVVLTLR